MNTLKNYTSKPESAYSNMPSSQISVIWRTLDFGTKFIQKTVTDKNFEKVSIKIVISMQPFNPVQNFSCFAELQIMGPDLP